MPADWYTAALAMAQSKAREMLCVLVRQMCEQRHTAARVFPSFHFARNATCSSGLAFSSLSASSRSSRAAVASALVAVIIANAKVTSGALSSFGA